MIDPAEIPLRDIHLPETIGWWPLATAWWVLAGLLLVTLITCAVIFVQRRRFRVRRLAAQEFTAIEQRYETHRDAHQLARELSVLARRTALALVADRDVAARTGERWQTTLDELSAIDSTHVEIAATLSVAPYRNAETFDGDALLDQFRLWVTNLRPGSLTSQ